MQNLTAQLLMEGEEVQQRLLLIIHVAFYPGSWG